MKERFFQSHPYWFALVSILSIYPGARLIASPLQLIRPILVLCGLIFFLDLLLKKLIKDSDSRSLGLTIFVFGFYYNQQGFVYLGSIVILFSFSVFCVRLLLKKGNNVHTLSVSLAWIGALMAVSQVVILAVLLSAIPFSYYESMISRSKNLVLPLDASTALKPDIYYIVLDGYPREDVLREIYGYDNGEFIRDLEDLGFVVPDDSHSNYARTSVSVSSTLDMQYWESISPNMEDAVFWWMVEPVMDHNRTRASLESIGYQSVSIATDWGITNNPTTDMYLKPYPIILSDYENFLISSTPLQYLYKPFQQLAPITDNNVHREFTTFGFAELKRLAGVPGPKFVFSHIIAPHPPFVFEADGSPIDSTTGFTFDSPRIKRIEPEVYKQGYIEQVKYVNDQMRLVIDELLENSAIPPIIIIQADHGSAIHIYFTEPERSCMKERFSNFAAYYLPGTSSTIIPENISAVNIFRIVLNEYFGADLELLEDRQYFMNGFRLFDNLDVTERADEQCNVAE